MLRIEYITLDATARYEADGGDMFSNSNWIMS